MIQYTEYSSIPQAVRDLVANKISLLDSYILMQTGDQQFTALVNKPALGCKQYVISRSGNYGNQYTVTETTGNWDYTVRNEYYVYSNVGYGAALDLPVVDHSIAHACVILACVLMMAIVFKGALFPCLRRRR